MPGLYTERHSRKQPTYDPSLSPVQDPVRRRRPGALSHDYQLHCPNDANLVAVIGRGPDTGPLPAPPLTDRHGIPNVGKCIRCNVQLEGSGVSADDVIVEAGDPKAGNGGPSAVGHQKDVGIFVDRADGFVLRNMTIRHAREHDIYVLETDGYLLDRFKTFFAGGYGVLTFVGTTASSRTATRPATATRVSTRAPAPTRPTTGTCRSTRSGATARRSAAATATTTPAASRAPTATAP